MSAHSGWTYPLICLLINVMISGCASIEQTPMILDSEPQARIRIFHGPSVYLYLGDVCDGNEHPVIHAAAGGFSFLASNKTLAMPRTDDMPFSYHEYAIPSGKPLTVRMYWQAQNAGGTWERCGPIYTMFTPEAGQDYDTFMKFRGGVCQGVEVRKLMVGAEGKISTMPAPLNGLPFQRCRFSVAVE